MGAATEKQQADSLLKLARKQDKELRADILNELSWTYRNSNMSLADSFARAAITLSDKLNYYKGLGYGYVRLAIVSRTRGEYADAIDHCNHARLYGVMADDEKLLASAYNTLASIYLQTSRYKLAVYYFNLSAQLSGKINDKQGMAASLNNIGVIFAGLKNYAKALHYYTNAYRIYDELSDENGMADELNNIASIYHILHQPDTAIQIYNQSFTINRQLNDKRDMAVLYNNIGLIYDEKSDSKTALDYYLKALSLNEELGDIESILHNFISVADCYIKLDMMHAAERYINEALTISAAYNLKSGFAETYLVMHEMEKKKKNAEKALYYYKIHTAYLDSIQQQMNNSRLEELESDYEQLKTENHELRQSYEKEMTDLIKKEREKTILQYISIIGMVLILFVLIVYVVFFIMRKDKT
jgi:tetratricopeptide (TPR) repeat protein